MENANLQAHVARLEIALVDLKDMVFSANNKLARMETLENKVKETIKEAQNLLAEMMEEVQKIKMLYNKLQSVEALDSRYAEVEGQIYALKDDQDILRGEVAQEIQTIQAAIAHSRKESPQLFEIGSKFYFTRPKAVATILTLECILRDLAE